MVEDFIIAIDLGGTNLKIALLDAKYRIRDRRFLNTRRFGEKEGLIRGMAEAINDLLGCNRLSKKKIRGLGVGLPGPVDNRRGIVHFLPNIAGWKEVRLKQILEKKLGLAVFLDNDANLMSLAEYKLGAAQGSRYAVCLTLGTGVGAGIIIEGKIYRGADNASAEVGHIPINENGPRCKCGGRACLESYIGNRSIEKLARRLFGRNISLEELGARAKAGNKKALAIWSSLAHRLGVALVGVVNLLNPDCIVIGGGVAGAGKILFERVRKVVEKQAMRIQGRRVKILQARLGSDAGLIGAAIMVREARAK